MGQREVPRTSQIDLLRAETTMILRHDAAAKAAKRAQGRSQDRTPAEDANQERPAEFTREEDSGVFV